MPPASLRFRFLLAALSWLPACLPAQDAARLPIPSQARFLEPLPDGAPPPEPPAAPRLVFRPKDILASRTRTLAGQKITIQRVAPLLLPPPKPAVKPPAARSAAASPAPHEPDGAETARVFLGASVFHAQDRPGQARSLVRFQTARGASLLFWSSADWELMGGFASFEDGNGKSYSLLMALSVQEVERQDGIAAVAERRLPSQALPDLPDSGPAAFAVVEGVATAEDLAVIESLHALYNGRREELAAALLGRKRAAEERARQAQEARAHPPQKKELVLRCWRVDQAGQNGVTPQPATLAR